MDKTFFPTKMIGLIAIIIIIGMLWHELYKTTNITVLSLICPVNESKWEHWKMALWPMIIVGAFEYIFLQGQVKNYLFSLAIGILVFEAVTFGLIELYELFFGKSHLALHITTFLLGAFSGQFIRYLLMQTTSASRKLFWIGAVIIGVQIIIFSVFTVNPPRWDYFMDSISQTYGIKGKSR